jgi:glycosyltransferase involved in cell wall biosynthesis
MSESGQTKIGIVLPAHNEEKSICSLMDEIHIAISNEFPTARLEIVVVDDGSTDHTCQAVADYSLKKSDFDVTLVSFTRNFGKEAAMYAGLERLVNRMDRICLMDSDGQHPPTELIRMLKESFQSNSCVAGFQDYSSNGFAYRLGAKILRMIRKSSSDNNPSGLSDFRVLTNFAVQSFLNLPERARFSRELFDYLGIPTIFLEYEVAQRSDGTNSRWTRRGLVGYAMTAITSRGVLILPSILFASLAVITSVISYAIVVSIKSISDGSHNGTASILFALVMFQIIQFVFLFFISAIVANLMIEAKKRPLFVVRSDSELTRFRD